MKRRLYKILMLLFMIGSLNFPAAAQEHACAVTEETPMTVTAEWLKKHIGHKNLVLLHVGNREEYDAGHIPGAQYISLQDISKSAEETDLRLQLPAPERLKTVFEKFGIGNDSRIIVYFGKDWVTPTTRVYFTLDYIGLGKNASILDGGMPAWTAAGNSLSTEVPAPQRGRLKVRAGDELVAASGWIGTRLKDPAVKIIDARTPHYYDGTRAGGYPRPGHIAGAKNIPYADVVGEDNKLKDEAVLRKMFTDAGVKPYDTVVTYCHIGQQASLLYFVAKKLGYKTRLYDGSFEEWSANRSLAVNDPLADTRGTRVAVVGPDWIKKHAGEKDVRILDVRPNVYDYFAGHVPNAVHLADAALRAPREGYPTQYLEPFMLGRLFANAGIKKGDRVAVYSDDSGVLGAAMVIYLLERLGHAEIFFIDGGFRDYRMNHPTAQDYPMYKPAGFDVLDNKKIGVALEEVKNAIGKPGITFVDARPPEVYRGEKKIWKRNGHIPGAVNVPWTELTEENNPHKLKPVAEMREIFTSAGVRPTDEIIVYCGTGREASLEYMILKHVLKAPRVRLYEGSWAEYANHPQLAVATGAEN